MKSCERVTEWREGAALEFGDPAVPVCQLFFCWTDLFAAYQGDDLVCGTMLGQFGVRLGPGEMIPMSVVEGNPVLDMIGCVAQFGATKIADGLWSLTPSLNLPEVIHGFVVLYGVPNPAPWERRVVLP